MGALLLIGLFVLAPLKESGHLVNILPGGGGAVGLGGGVQSELQRELNSWQGRKRLRDIQCKCLNMYFTIVKSIS